MLFSRFTLLFISPMFHNQLIILLLLLLFLLFLSISLITAFHPGKDITLRKTSTNDRIARNDKIFPRSSTVAMIHELMVMKMKFNTTHSSLDFWHFPRNYIINLPQFVICQSITQLNFDQGIEIGGHRTSQSLSDLNFRILYTYTPFHCRLGTENYFTQL